jgi:hypothetical protein
MRGTAVGPAGTAEYAAPEAFNPPAAGQQEATREQALPKADVYSFCIMLHHVMTRVKPFAECESAMQVLFAVAGGRRPDARLLRQAGLREVVARGWDAKWDVRPSMQELLAVLDPAAAVLARDEQEARNDASLCVVCIERPRSHVLTPCGHFCVCEQDAALLAACPICRVAIAGKHKLFQ